VSYGDYLNGVQGSLMWLLNHDLPQSPDVQAMLRYRYDVTVSAVEVLAATMPPVGGNNDARRLKLLEVPTVELARRVKQTMADTRELPSRVSLIGTDDRSEHLLAWRSAGKASLEAERELHTVLRAATPEQRWAAVKDAADTLRGLCVLDARYESLDRWVPLRNRAELGIAAVAVSALATEGDVDYTIDTRTVNQRRRRPVTAAGVPGAAQAQRNLAIDLQRPPAARSFRLILVAQMRMSAGAARLAEASNNPTRKHWNDRANIYRQLVDASRDVDGLAGSRPLAVESAARSAALVSSATNGTMARDGQLQVLARVTQHVDVAVRAAIERGLTEGLYLIPTGEKQLSRGAGGIVRAEHTWRPADPEDPVPLRDLARRRLRIPPAPGPTPQDIEARRAQRATFESLLAQPGLRPAGPGAQR
jgi:hypothetical protein